MIDGLFLPPTRSVLAAKLARASGVTVAEAEAHLAAGRSWCAIHGWTRHLKLKPHVCNRCRYQRATRAQKPDRLGKIKRLAEARHADIYKEIGP
jgi:hypothetical protein